MAAAESAVIPAPSLIVGLRLNGKQAAVFGQGQAAANRAVFALDAGANVVVYGSDVPDTLTRWISSGRLSVVPASKYASSDIPGFGVVLVTESTQVSAQAVAQDAHAAGVPVNVAGNAELSDFSLLPTYRGSSSLQIAVTTNGIAPRVANQVLKEIVNKLPSELESQLKEVARLNYIAQETERKRSEVLAKLDATSTPADISTAATATQTPASPLSSSGSVAAESQDSQLMPDLAALRGGGVQVEQLTDIQIASSYVAHALSDLCFVYSAPEQELGEAALAWSRKAEKNAYGEWVSALRMETRQGAGHALWGALSSGSRVSAIAAAPSLPYMLPVLNELVARQQPVVLHVSTQSLDDAVSAQTDFSDAFIALQSGAVFLASATAQEAHDMALVAHAVAQAARVPVVHLANGASTAARPAAVKLATHASLSAFIDALSAQTNKAGQVSPAEAVENAFVRFREIFGRAYHGFEYAGGADAETIFVSLGDTASQVQSILPSILKESDVGLLSVRTLRPWSLDSLVAILPKSATRIVVLGAAKDNLSSDTLFSDIAAGVFIGRPLSPIRVASENIYGLDSAGITNIVRGTLGLELVEAEGSAGAAAAAGAKTPTDGAAVVTEPAKETPLAVTEPSSVFESTLAIAKRLAFPEAFSTKVAPRANEKTYTVKVSSLYRMTPESYDRNIIHIEFDTRGTDLTYEIGDALGVFGYNDAAQVRRFCEAYGIDGDQYATAVKDGECQTRSVHSWLTHALDLFGRPSKKFYAALADFATDQKEAEKLRWLTTSEGSVEFKDRVADTVTYADLLLEFASARPSILFLIDLIAPIKPRHYSIASSAKMHPGSVHLCVVTVEWKNSKGELRTGQCTRFLNSLSIGDSVVVSVKPSVMKLPPLDSQPVVMAGLGTGMAPFRAFIEERAFRKLQGADVGPMTLYFGSRHRAMEYLYGEELEAYHADGLLTNLRLAFSRDQKEKVYIQHKMRSDSELLASQMLKQNGSFYLCGPTWPTGDVKDAMVNAFTTIGGVKSSEASKVIEELKESERYILEVY
ncbi:sulfite reductase [NADPH] flavoprotein component [Dipsacomyces acuminosporus]|nr:sulfite reductase [NADPH] flavoprotein component [Dipsacomyces acuminosporus]